MHVHVYMYDTVNILFPVTVVPIYFYIEAWAFVGMLENPTGILSRKKCNSFVVFHSFYTFVEIIFFVLLVFSFSFNLRVLRVCLVEIPLEFI